MKHLLTLLLLVACAPGLRAQQAAADEQPSAARLSAEIETLKSEVSTWEKILKGLPHISGYVQLGCDWSDATQASFYIKRVRLMLDGDIAPRLDYRVQIEFASPKVVDAYLRYRPFDCLNLQVGEFKLPFGIENTEYAPLNFELIEYPVVLQRLMGFCEEILHETLAATGRDMGAQLYGGFWKRDGYSILNYNLGVFNGEGINARDRNKSKDIAARMTVRPVQGLALSGSYYRGEFGRNYTLRLRYAAGACYDHGRAVVRGEWIGGKTDDFRSDGWYVLGGWRIRPNLMPVFRYEAFRENTKIADTHQSVYTAGLTWQPFKHLRCQLNYSYEDYKAPQVDNRNTVSLMLSGMF